MRYLLLLPTACIALAACATPATPKPAGASSLELTLERGASAELTPGVRLTFESVDDSRCPPGVQCVWAGRLSYRFSIRRGGDAPESFILSPAQPEAAPGTLAGGRLQLDTATIPAPPAQGAAIVYRATLTIIPA
jgi:hypothetical protein